MRRRHALVVLLAALSAACGSASGPSATSPAANRQSAASTTSPSPTTPTSPSQAPTASPRPAIGHPADDGARIVEVTTVDARTRDLKVDSPAVGMVGVTLLLPKAFEAKPTTDWPVLFLLHGATGMHSDWTQFTDAEDVTASTDLLVVLPDAGDFGFYSDWWNQGKGGPPEWETFHLVELRQLLERNWHAGDKRVVAGLSMGGYGAMEYAERQPGFFLAAASFSGALDPIEGQIDIGTDDLWGDPVAQADNWRAHDPTINVAALKGTALYVSYGDGGKGPLDRVEPPSDDLEPWIADQNRAFVGALAKAKIPATVKAYGPGSHDWPYWERGLHESLPLLLKALE